MRALELACRCVSALPFMVAALFIGLLWALSVPVVWAMGLGKGEDQ